jgi:hypothetical protein
VPPVAGVTVTEDVPLLPSLAAVIVADPEDTPVTTPVFVFTLATDGASELQVMTRPVSTLLFTSLSVAVNDCAPPTVTVAGDGLTVTVATGTAVTVMAAVPTLPSLVAVIVTGPPGAIPVTTPVLALTVANAALFEVHVIERPVRTLPLASFVMPVSS